MNLQSGVVAYQAVMLVLLWSLLIMGGGQSDVAV